MHKLSIENKIENLDKVAGFIEEFCEENNLVPKVVFELNLVLDELVTNTITYGYRDKDVHTIDILVEKKADLIELRVIDDAREFNPLEKDNVDLTISLQEKQIGGLGIHLVKQKMDEIKYERKGNKNFLYMNKKINTHGEK